MNKTANFKTGGKLEGVYVPPGDKSVSHRAVMFGALAEGESHYTNFLCSEDCLATAHAFQKMGVKIEIDEASCELRVHGKGMREFATPTEDVYLGNSGTSIRLLMGILAGQKMEVTLTGDESLSKRPMKRVTQPLKQMGAQIKGGDKGNFAPLTIRGGSLKGIEYDNKLGSAQVKSAILFAGMYADGDTVVREPLPSRDHTERMLTAAGANFESKDGVLRIRKTEALKPMSGVIPGDISSAAFFIVGAALTPGSKLKIDQVGLNPFRTGLLKVLQRMGAKIEVSITSQEPEPIGTITVEGGTLKGTRIEKAETPSLIDELPIITVAMALAEGESLVSGAEELRVKETDRIHSMVSNLKAIGGQVEELPDGCMIKGIDAFKGGKIRSFGDHRTAMSFALASMRSESPIEVEGTECVATSFPTFFDHFDSLRQA